MTRYGLLTSLALAALALPAAPATLQFVEVESGDYYYLSLPGEGDVHDQRMHGLPAEAHQGGGADLPAAPHLPLSAAGDGHEALRDPRFPGTVRRRRGGRPRGEAVGLGRPLFPVRPRQGLP